jgi:hypothetical protein
MRRRDFVKGVGVAGGLAALPWRAVAEAAFAQTAVGAPEAMAPESRRAWAELMALVAEAERRTLSAEWNLRSPQDVIDGHRVLLHLLAASIDLYLEGDPERPYFGQMPSPTRKYLGDNPDAHYFFTVLRGDRRFRIRGNTSGAVYTSFTFQSADQTGAAGGITAARNHTQFDVAPDGSYELVIGPGASGRNGVPLDAKTVSVTTRHYFENELSAQLDPTVRLHLSIEPLDALLPAPAWSDAESARRLRAAAGFFRQTTLDMPPRDPKQQPEWVSTVPNQLGTPALQGGREDVSAWGAVDNAYSMGPFVLKADEALVMSGRLPKCSFANVVLWNRWMASFEYRGQRISLNRKQMKLEPDGSYRIVIAHREPGVPNWLTTEGRPSGTIFWRFQLPQEPPERPRTQVMPVADVAKG